MTKCIVSLCLDVETTNWLREQKNYSKIVNNAIKSMMNIKKSAKKTSNMGQIDEEIAKIQSKMAEFSLILQEKTQQKSEILEIIKKKQEPSLIEEQKKSEEIKKLEKCFLCGTILKDKGHIKYNKGNACFSCVAIASREEEKSWNS